MTSINNKYFKFNLLLKSRSIWTTITFFPLDLLKKKVFILYKFPQKFRLCHGKHISKQN